MVKRIVVMVALTAVAACAGANDFQANPVPAIGQNAQNQTAFDVGKKGPRVLFVGNSITLHGPRPQIGWTDNWGMAASARDKDYVHQLQAKIAAAQPEAQCCLLQVAGTIERAFYNADWDCGKNFTWARAFKPDVIVLFFGANVPGDYDNGKMKAARSFGSALDAFLDYLDPEGKALVLISQGFYVRPKLDAEKEAVAKRRGAVFVNIEDIRARADAHGRYNHPGDLGMQLIAERFWEKMADYVRSFKR
ncbi:MAG: SGNH/GDSL hydrolase family protein [Kiritimatiellia bacterium]